MRWKGRQASSNVDDRRGGRGGGRGKKLAGGGIVTIVIVIAVALMGGDPSGLIQNMGGGQTSAPNANYQPSDEEQELAQFVSVVLKDTEDVWNKLFREQLRRSYKEPTLVLFTREVVSGCGKATASTGPFYCSADQSLYIDLSFYRELKEKFKAPGDFAMAYVVAHEVAHHVQYLLGITPKVHAARRQLPKEEYNQLSVKLELQADFLAGVWANHAQKMKNVLEAGDIDEALRAAHAIGDDAIQKQAMGYVVPESLTDGTSAQRKRWFNKGLQSGDINKGDTFSASAL